MILQEYALWQHVQQGQQGQFQEQLDRIDTQRQHLERQLQRLIDAYQQEIITLHDLATRREQITQRLKGSSRNGTTWNSNATRRLSGTVSRII